MPIDLVRQTRPDIAKPELKGSDLAWWVETMKQQDMLQGSPRPDQTGPALIEDADTLAERATQRIEADIVRGALAPNARLGIAETAARYGVGATPLREALSRLAARGLVNAIGKRGFRVQSISRDDLADIVRIRSVLEREAIRLSIAAGDGAWEGEIVGALASAQALRRRESARASARGAGVRRSAQAVPRLADRRLRLAQAASPPAPASTTRLIAIVG